MTVENLLRRGLTVGLVLSLVSFALSYIMSLLDNKMLGKFATLFATLVLVLTPILSIAFMAVEEVRRKNYWGFMIAAFVILIAVISILLAISS